MNILQAQNISFAYGKKTILKNIDFSIEQGDVIALLGPNGSGKSTLMKVLLGLYKAQGEIRLEGKKLSAYSKKEMAQKIAYVPQMHKIPFAYTVLEVVMMGRLAHTTMFSNYTANDYTIAMQSLEKVGMHACEKQPYAILSGGQQQLVLIARALAQEAKILFMDEPVNGLDYGNQIKLLRLVKSLAKEGYTFLKTTHYPDHALYATNRVAMMQHGEMIGCDKTTSLLTAQTIQMLYGIEVVLEKTKQGVHFCVPVL